MPSNSLRISSDRRAFLAVGGLLIAMTALPRAARAGKPAVFTGLVDGVGAGGHDVVAYFSGASVPGDPAITASWNGVTWRFSTEANRDAFLANPDGYAPQFGGYCAFAVSEGYTAKGDPEAWTVHEGKLYLNYNRSVRARWARDIDQRIKAGEANWPRVLD